MLMCCQINRLKLSVWSSYFLAGRIFWVREKKLREASKIHRSPSKWCSTSSVEIFPCKDLQKAEIEKSRKINFVGRWLVDPRCGIFLLYRLVDVSWLWMKGCNGIVNEKLVSSCVVLTSLWYLRLQNFLRWFEYISYVGTNSITF